MNCDELIRMLPGYLDADMKVELCHELEEHTKQCSYCRAHVRTMQGTIELTRDLSIPPVHQEWLNRLRRRVCTWQGQADGSGEAGD
jgi:predicted anti-sigma-YlaC factor YlaD